MHSASAATRLGVAAVGILGRVNQLSTLDSRERGRALPTLAQQQDALAGGRLLLITPGTALASGVNAMRHASYHGHHYMWIGGPRDRRGA